MRTPISFSGGVRSHQRTSKPFQSGTKCPRQLAQQHSRHQVQMLCCPLGLHPLQTLHYTQRAIFLWFMRRSARVRRCSAQVLLTAPPPPALPKPTAAEMRGAQPGKQPRQQTASSSMVWWCSQLTDPRPGRQKPSTLQQQMPRCEIQNRVFSRPVRPVSPPSRPQIHCCVQCAHMRSCAKTQLQNRSLPPCQQCQGLCGTLPESHSAPRFRLVVRIIWYSEYRCAAELFTHKNSLWYSDTYTPGTKQARPLLL